MTANATLRGSGLGYAWTNSTLPYSGAVALGSFLLFQIQPMIARFILPWFGGSPAVWTTCLLFFQVALLAGYAYARRAKLWRSTCASSDPMVS